MDINILSRHDNVIKGPLPIEWIMLAYCLITFILAAFLWNNIEAAPILNRLYILTGTAVLWGLYRYLPCQLTYLLRILFQILLLGYWYPDIYYFAKFMPNTDHLFASVDQFVFGCQPAVMFRQILPGLFWKELFNMGYFSYYLMILCVFIWPLFHHYRLLDYSTCVMVCSFMLFYFIFLLLQSAGPQFYFQHIGSQLVSEGKFPAIGDWFCYHPQLIHDHSTPNGLFSSLVEIMQQGEKPIAAFPSSVHHHSHTCPQDVTPPFLDICSFLLHTLPVNCLYRSPLCHRRLRRLAVCNTYLPFVFLHQQQNPHKAILIL